MSDDQEQRTIGGRSIAIAAGLAVFNLLFVTGPLLAGISLLAAFSGVALVLVSAPVFGVVTAVNYGLVADTMEILFLVFAGMVSAGMGVLLAASLIWLTGWVGRGLCWYWRFNLDMIRGK